MATNGILRQLEDTCLFQLGSSMSKKMLFGWSAVCDLLEQFILTNKITQFWLRLNYKVSIVVRYYAWRYFRGAKSMPGFTDPM